MAQPSPQTRLPIEPVLRRASISRGKVMAEKVPETLAAFNERMKHHAAFANQLASAVVIGGALTVAVPSIAKEFSAIDYHKFGIVVEALAIAGVVHAAGALCLGSGPID